jgi:hypothetical protein
MDLVSDTVDQPGLKPTRKVTTATAAGAASVLIVFVAGQLGVDFSPEAGAAIATLLAFAGGYFPSERAPAREATTYAPTYTPTRRREP